MENSLLFIRMFRINNVRFSRDGSTVAFTTGSSWLLFESEVEITSFLYTPTILELMVLIYRFNAIGCLTHVEHN